MKYEAVILQAAKSSLWRLEIWHADLDRCEGCVLDLEITALRAAISATEARCAQMYAEGNF